MIELKFDSMKQLQIFFLLVNNKSGLERNDISERICIPRTTVFDNLSKLLTRKIKNIPYVSTYKIKLNKKGRPKIYWYIPKGIVNFFFSIDIEITIKEPYQSGTFKPIIRSE